MSDPTATSMTPTSRPQVDFFRSAKAVFRLFLPATFWSRRALFFGLLAALLPGIAAVFLMWKAIPATEQLRGGYIFYTNTFFLVHYIVLLAALFFGTSVVADELENQTLTYLSVRPVPKTALLLGKAAATWTTGALLIGSAILLTYTMLTLGDGILSEYVLNGGLIETERIYSGHPSSFLRQFPILLQDLALTLGAFAVYVAIFTFIGAYFNKPVMWGIALAFGWESWVAYIPGLTRKLTVMHYIQSLTTHATGKNMAVQLVGQSSSTGQSILALLFIFVLFTGLAVWTFSSREYIFDLSKQ